MKELKKHISKAPEWIPYLLSFIIVFIYFTFYADYVLYYQEKSSLFIFSTGFLFDNLKQPGGFLLYMGKFLTTFFYVKAAGALIIAGIITTTMILVSGIIKRLADNAKPLAGLAPVISVFPGFALFFLQTDYRFMLFFSLGILMQTAFIFISLKHIRQTRGGLIIIMLTPIWYYLTGSFAAIAFLFLTIFFLSVNLKKHLFRLALIWMLNLLVFYILKEFILFQPGKILLTFPLNELIKDYTLIFYSLSVLIILLPALSLIRSGKGWDISSSKISLITTVFTVTVLILTGGFRFNKKAKEYFHAEKLFSQGNYDELISYNAETHTSNILTLFLNNIALCEEGKLDDQLFRFAQSPDGKTLFLKWEMTGEILKHGGYFYYVTGMVNEAHRWAYENMVMSGYTPEGLKMLIKTDLLNGNYRVAAKYINILAKTLFYRQEAIHFKKMVFNDSAVRDDKELSEESKIRIKNDFFIVSDDPLINVEMVLAKDSLNRAAFEYKMAYLLLRKDYREIAKELPRFARMGYNHLPVHIEEAVLAITVANRGRMPDTGGLKISTGTMNKWTQYLSVLRQYGNDAKAAEPALRRKFGGTFWYWVFYR